MKRSIIHPTEAEDAEINAAAMSDPDALPMTDAQLAELQPFKKVFGRPKAAVKKKITTVRFDPEVLDFFQKQGAKWQTRINDVLVEYVRNHK